MSTFLCYDKTMKELIEKVENLKKELDNSKEVKHIKELNSKINDNKELISLIEKYNETQNESIKEQIINNEFFRGYKLSENEINYIILEINSKLKQISKKGSCSK